jgi:general stress protein 26
MVEQGAHPMSHDPAELAAKFWKSLKNDRTLMISLASEGGAESRPMTAHLDGDVEDYADGGPVYIFTAKDTGLVEAMQGKAARAAVQFAAKDHDLFATLGGVLSPTNDRAVIDRLWNPFVAAWYEGGKDDPKLQLLRFDAGEAHIWLNETSLFAGLKMLFGADPKEDYADKKADIALG